MAALADELLADDLAGLCCHKFGYQVALAIISFGLARQRAAVVAVLRGNMRRLTRHRYASVVTEHALLRCSPEERLALAEALMEVGGAVTALACHTFGVNVVRALLQAPEASQRALAYIQKSPGRLQKDKFGAQLLRELGPLGR